MTDGPGTSWDHVEARWGQSGVLYMSGQANVHRCHTIARVVVSGSTFKPMLGDYALHQLPVVLVKSRLHRYTGTGKAVSRQTKTRPNASHGEKLCPADGGG